MKNLLRGLKNQTFDPIEVKVRDATSSDPWGAPSTLMAELAEATQDYAQYPKLFLMLWKRLKDYQIHMHVQKALLLVEYLLRNGSDRFVRDAQFRADDVAKLKRYKYYNKNNEDIAGDIRKKAKVVHDLLTNADQLAEEREKAMQLRGVRTSHAAPAAVSRDETTAPKRAARPAAAGAGDAYDNYSDVSKQEAFEQAVREEVERRQKAEAAARRKAQGQAQAQPEEYEEPYEEPAPAARPKPKAAARPSGSSSAAPGGKPRPKPAAQPVQQQYEEEEDAQQAPPRLQQPTKPKNSKARAPSQQMQPQQQDDPFAFDNAFAQPQDPFNPNAHQQPRPKKNVDMFLADALGNNSAPQQQSRQQPAASTNIDLLTGAFENQQISMDDYDQYDDGQHPGDGGQVMWEPENEEEEEQPQQPPQQQQQPHRGGGGDWGDLINLDNVTAEKKQAAPKKQGKPMSEMAAKRGSVIMGSAIDGFEAPAASGAPAPAPYYGGANSPPAYGANYPPNNNYGYGGPMMGGGPMAGGGAPMGGYPPMAGYPPAGGPAPAQPGGARRQPAPAQPAANPFNW